MDEIGIGPTEQMSLRISCAVLMRLCFEHPTTGQSLLVLERTASRRRSVSEDQIEVKAKPVGGGVQIFDLAALQAAVGDFRFDSQRSRSEADFRIFIPPEKMETVIDFCLEQFRDSRSPVLDTLPERELLEELHDSLGGSVSMAQFEMKWLKAVVQTVPIPSSSPRARDVKTHHIYTIHQVKVIDPSLAKALVANSQRFSDEDLAQRAWDDIERGGWGRANAVLALPWAALQQAYENIQPSDRSRDQSLFEHILTGSVRHLLDAPAGFDVTYTA
jgi:hypothetical protein